MGRYVVGALLILLAVVFTTIGVAFVVVVVPAPESTCAFKGYPPLPVWSLGTGISCLIIGVSYVVVFSLAILVFPESIDARDGYTQSIHWSISLHSALSTAFLFAWMIVGCVSLWRDGINCADPNSQVWNTGMAGVILLIVYFSFLAMCGVSLMCAKAFVDGWDADDSV